MTSDAVRAPSASRRGAGMAAAPAGAMGFPWGLTLAAALVFAIMIGLGLWQLRRLEWKQGQLARIAALASAPATPIAPVLRRAAAGQDVSFARVFADCAAGSVAAGFRMSVDAGDWVSRPQAICRLDGAPFDAIAVDRGILGSSRGSAEPPALVLPPPARVQGVLRARPGRAGLAGVARPAPYVLVAEREFPSAPGVTPAPGTAQAPGNLKYVGSYAPTWFGLAGVLACYYAAMLWRRYHPRP